jgi:hypothetical protein
MMPRNPVDGSQKRRASARRKGRIPSDEYLLLRPRLPERPGYGEVLATNRLGRITTNSTSNQSQREANP